MDRFLGMISGVEVQVLQIGLQLLLNLIMQVGLPIEVEVVTNVQNLEQVLIKVMQ